MWIYPSNEGSQQRSAESESRVKCTHTHTHKSHKRYRHVLCVRACVRGAQKEAKIRRCARRCRHKRAMRLECSCVCVQQLECLHEIYRYCQYLWMAGSAKMNGEQRGRPLDRHTHCLHAECNSVRVLLRQPLVNYPLEIIRANRNYRLQLNFGAKQQNILEARHTHAHTHKNRMCTNVLYPASARPQQHTRTDRNARNGRKADTGSLKWWVAAARVGGSVRYVGREAGRRTSDCVLVVAAAVGRERNANATTADSPVYASVCVCVQIRAA